MLRSLFASRAHSAITAHIIGGTADNKTRPWWFVQETERGVSVYYFLVVATGDMWQCKRGSEVVQEFDNLGEALALAEVEASVYRPSQVAVQDEDGNLEVVSRYVAFH